MIALAAAACGSPPAPPVPAPPPADAPVVPGPVLHGLCDASAAVAVGRFLVVADDEHNALRVFDWSRDAAPVAPIDLAALSPMFAGPEADLEGMAVATDGIVWVTGSHDSGKEGTRTAERQRLVGLTLTAGPDGVAAALAAGPTADFVERAQWTNPLLGIIDNTTGFPSKDPRGLAIEGLAAGPAGSVVFGFRAPVHAGKALVERLDNPAGLTRGEDPRMVGPRWLDLGDGRGIRAIEADGAGFLLVAGPPGGEGRFDLFRWTGFDERADKPVRVPVDLGDLQVEGLVNIDGAWWVLSDDGDVEIGGERCKKLPEAERRARTARLPQ